MNQSDAKFIDQFMLARRRNRDFSGRGVLRALPSPIADEEQACVEKWMGLRESTERDDTAAEEAIHTLYRWAGKEPPEEILWFDSPDLAQLQVSMLRLGAGPESYHSDPFDFAELIDDAVLFRLAEQTGIPVTQHRWCCRSSWHLQGHLNAVDSLSRFLGQSIQLDVIRGLRLHGASQEWLNRGLRWLTWHTPPFGAFAGVDLTVGSNNLSAKAALEIGANLARYVSFLWLFQRSAVVCRKPIEIHVDEGHRLHNPSGPAVVFRGEKENWNCWCWHGIAVPQKIIESPDSIQIAEIENETNVEFRRILLERFGLARYLKEAHVEETARDDYGTLYRNEIPGDEPLVLVRVANKTPEPNGDFKEYFIRVPPQVGSAKEAVAWTFGLSVDDYSPQAES